MTFLWLPLAIASYLLQAVNGAIDRVIIHREITTAEVVSFWVALFSGTTLSLLLIGLLPFEFAESFRFVRPQLWVLSLVLVAGFLSQAGLLYMYRSLGKGEATKVLTTVGAVTPIATLLFSYMLLSDVISGFEILAFAVLVFGAIVLSFNPRKAGKVETGWLSGAFASSVILALQTVIAKIVFDSYHFISAFALMSLGSLLFALLLFLASSSVRQSLISEKSEKGSGKSQAQKKQVYWIIGNSMLGGVAVIVLNLAIKLGSPSLVNALRGVQYAGVFFIALFLARNHAALLDEDLSRRAVTQKILGILLIIGGIALITL